jgi:DNA polymerase I
MSDIHKLPDGTCWNQSKKGLLPQIVEEMFTLRDEYKDKMKAATDPIEKAGWNTMQLAVKRVMASFYGMTASAHWGWVNFDIASAITACGREAIKFLLEESEKQGYNALYGHTDSAFVQMPFDEAQALADHLTIEAQKQLNANQLFVEFEVYMPYWVIGGKNLYYGICSWPPENEGEPKSARWGKISTLAPISRNLERDVLTMLCEGSEESKVIKQVRPISLLIKKGKVGLDEVSGVMRLGKNPEDYSPSHTPNGAKGALYYNQHMATKSKQSKYYEDDSVKWLYVNGVPDGMPHSNIVAYRSPEELEGFSLDWETMVDTLVTKKIKPIFKSMGWSIDRASGAAMPKVYW